MRSQSGARPTQYTYTSQYSHTADFGLMDYVARWYDPVLGRFAQADSLVPGAGNPIAFDRYAYVFNSPLNFTDPSGHVACELLGDAEDVRACQVAKFSGEGFNAYMATLEYPDVKPIEAWTISQEGIDFIKSQEGFYSRMYNDGCKPDQACFYDRNGNGVGHCTIGYGHLIHRGPCDGSEKEIPFINGLNPEEADALLMSDIAAAERELKKGAAYHNITTPITQYQYDALVSLIMNWGERPFFYDITPTPKNPYAGEKLALLIAGDYYGLALHIQMGPVTSNGVEMPGLVKRRQAEMEMFLTIVGY